MKTLAILLTLLVAACGGGNSNANDASYALMDSFEDVSLDVEVMEESVVDESFYAKSGNAPVQAPPTLQQPDVIEKKVIKRGGLTYQVEDTKEEYNRINGLLKQHDAYINSENESKGYDRINYSMNLKVPPQHFDAFILAISNDKKLDNRWVNMDDVTERYYDLQSRIENKKKLEERYQEILKKASTVKDILEVERNLNEVRGDIESLQGQFKLLNHKINYSSLDVSFYELIPYELDQEQRPGFGTRLLNAITGGWNGFLSFLVVIVRLWPFGIMLFGLVWLIKKIRKRKK